MKGRLETLMRRMEAMEQRRPQMRLLWVSDVSPETVLEPGDLVLTWADGSS